MGSLSSEICLQIYKATTVEPACKGHVLLKENWPYIWADFSLLYHHTQVPNTRKSLNGYEMRFWETKLVDDAERRHSQVEAHPQGRRQHTQEPHQARLFFYRASRIILTLKIHQKRQLLVTKVSFLKYLFPNLARVALQQIWEMKIATISTSPNNLCSSQIRVLVCVHPEEPPQAQERPGPRPRGMLLTRPSYL